MQKSVVPGGTKPTCPSVTTPRALHTPRPTHPGDKLCSASQRITTNAVTAPEYVEQQERPTLLSPRTQTPASVARILDRFQVDVNMDGQGLGLNNDPSVSSWDEALWTSDCGSEQPDFSHLRQAQTDHVQTLGAFQLLSAAPLNSIGTKATPKTADSRRLIDIQQAAQQQWQDEPPAQSDLAVDADTQQNKTATATPAVPAAKLKRTRKPSKQKAEVLSDAAQVLSEPSAAYAAWSPATGLSLPVNSQLTTGRSAASVLARSGPAIQQITGMAATARTRRQSPDMSQPSTPATRTQSAGSQRRPTVTRTRSRPFCRVLPQAEASDAVTEAPIATTAASKGGRPGMRVQRPGAANSVLDEDDIMNMPVRVAPQASQPAAQPGIPLAGQLVSPAGNNRKTTRNRVLTREEEQGLTRTCQDYIGIQVAQARMKLILKRQPHRHELARALKIPQSELAERLSRGMAAKRTLITRNMGLVVKLAKRQYNVAQQAGKTLSLTDLVEEGVQGLITAINKFNPDAGYKLSTYATPWITQYMQRAVLNQAALVKLPGPVLEDVSKLRRYLAQCKENNLGVPSEQQIAAALMWAPKRVATTMRASQLEFSVGYIMSLDSTGTDGEGSESCALSDMLSMTRESDELQGSMAVGAMQLGSTQEESLLAQDIMGQLNVMLEQIVHEVKPHGHNSMGTDVMLQALRLRFGLLPLSGVEGLHEGARDFKAITMNSSKIGASLEAVAAACNISSRELVRQLERKVIQRMREMPHSELQKLMNAYGEMEHADSMVPRARAGSDKRNNIR